MQTSKEGQTRCHKGSKASMLSHKGEGKACYKANQKANKRNAKLSKRGKRQAANKPKHHEDVKHSRIQISHQRGGCNQTSK